MANVEPETQYATMAQQAQTARLGMWAFLMSETLLFAALVAFYCAERAENAAAFDVGVGHMSLGIGTINTFVLLTSSLVVALALHALKAGRRGLAAGLVLLTVAMGGAFVALKLYEYGIHFDEGIYPGGRGAFFADHRARGLPAFFTLYFALTGLHALHVVAGMLALVWAAWGVLRGHISAAREHPLEFVALYWHMVDVVWVFLWPLLYLTKGGG